MYAIRSYYDNDKNQVVYNFGKHKGKTVEQVMKEEPGYYGWMMDADFPLYTKMQLKKEAERIKAKRQEEKTSGPTDMAGKLDRNNFV